MPTGPEECECEAPIKTASPEIPDLRSMTARTFNTSSRGIINVSVPTSAALLLPSLNTAARTLHASWKCWWNTLPYPPGRSIPISGVMSVSE